ncbi:ABC transporter substrate-binding protein [Aureimonas fodinaquatilis]|nr:ABC transporter substrate-binding protein [Aureimonas fodinaquatilis]
MMNRRIFGLITACAVFAGYTTASAQDLKEIIIAAPAGAGVSYYPLFSAMGEGYFADEGLAIRVEGVSGSAAVLQVLAAGQAQMGNAGPGAVLAARENGVDALYLYNYFAKSQFSIMVKEDADVSVPLDLKGKRIGVGTVDGAEVSFVRSVLTDAGMTEGDDYEFIVVGDGGMAAVGFDRGEIDAYASATRDAAILGLRGIPLKDITPEKFMAYFGNGFITTRDFMENNPEVMVGFGRALVRGAEFGADPANLPKVLEHAKIGNPQEGEDPAFATSLFHTIQGRITPTDLSNGWGYHHPEQWKLWEDALIASGGLKNRLDDLDKAYTNDFVEKWNEARN